MKYTANQFEEILNDLGIPKYDKLSKGGSIPDKANYGTWLRENNPDQFEKSLQEANSRTKETATQQVDIYVKITLQVDAGLEKEEIKKEIEGDLLHVLSKAHITLAPFQRKNVLDGVIPKETEIIQIKEEAEIYGND